MKEIDGWVKINKYTDDDGKPVCSGCPWEFTCAFDTPTVLHYTPSSSCPIWHGESKSEWQHHADEPRSCFRCGGKTKVIYCKTCQSILPQEK